MRSSMYSQRRHDISSSARTNIQRLPGAKGYVVISLLYQRCVLDIANRSPLYGACIFAVRSRGQSLFIRNMR